MTDWTLRSYDEHVSFRSVLNSSFEPTPKAYNFYIEAEVKRLGAEVPLTLEEQK